MCGEMAGDAVALPLLMGMGLDEYSMSSSSSSRTRSMMKSLDTTKCAELVDHVLNSALTNDDTEKMVKAFLSKHWTIKKHYFDVCVGIVYITIVLLFVLVERH